MPITTIKVVRGVFTDEQKSAMIQEVTEAMEQAWRLVAPKKAIKEFEDATY